VEGAPRGRIDLTGGKAGAYHAQFEASLEERFRLSPSSLQEPEKMMIIKTEVRRWWGEVKPFRRF
jgi:hypothetical protein